MAQTLKRAVSRANIKYTLGFFQTGHPYIPPYLANGWIGGCFDEFGFPSKPNYGYDQGRRQFSYVNHYRRYSNGGHNQSSLFYMTATRADGRAPGLAHLTAYHQELDLYHGELVTTWTERSKYRISAFTSMAVPQLFEMNFTSDLTTPADALTVRIHFDTAPADNNAVTHVGVTEPVQLAFAQDRATWVVKASTNCRTTELRVTLTRGTITREGTDLVFTLPEGEATLRVLVVDEELFRAETPAIFSAIELPTPQFRRDHHQAMARFWEESGNLMLPAGPAEKIWTRSKYYLAAAVAPFPSHIMVPTGLNGNIWRHGFPQDMFYVVENLPRLGLLERARAQMPYWLDNLEAVKRYTRRLADRDGAFYPWIPPFEAWDGFEVEGPTNADAYEFHNSAYVAAMVWGIYQISGDEAFLREHFPILEEVARFYAAITEVEDGKAVIRHPLVRSQDEATTAGAEISQPLCAVWSALYTFRVYHQAIDILAMGDAALTRRVGELLAMGYDFSRLEREGGFLRTYAEDDRPSGQQKHPVQLNPIALLPMADFMDAYPPVATAWEQRYNLTKFAHVPESLGWTFALFALASARMRSGQELARDLAMIQPARFADAQYIQFYESSDRLGWSHKKAYYFTTHGLYLQALTDAVVQYCRGGLDLFAALLPEWEGKDFSFQNLRIDGGLTVSGEWRAATFTVIIEATRDITLPVRVSRPIKGIVIEQPGQRPLSVEGNIDVPITFQAGKRVVLSYSPYSLEANGRVAFDHLLS